MYLFVVHELGEVAGVVRQRERMKENHKSQADSVLNAGQMQGLISKPCVHDLS